MFNISNYFSKFKRIYADESLKKQVVRDSIKAATGLELPNESITIKEGVIRISASPIARNEINMKKSNILKLLKSSDLNIVDIK